MINFNDVFLVSTDLAPETQSAIVRAEQTLGLTLPDGYKAFITRFGEGDYCYQIRIYGVERLLHETQHIQRMWAGSWYYGEDLDEEDEDVLTQAQAEQSVNLGSTHDSDFFMWYPPRPDRLYVLPRHDDRITVINADFSDLHTWNHSSDDSAASDPFLIFQSYHNQTALVVSTERTDFELNDLLDRFIRHWSDSPRHLVPMDDNHAKVLYLQEIGARIQMVKDDPKTVSGNPTASPVHFQITHVQSASAAIDKFLTALDDPGLNRAIPEQRAKHST